MSRYGPDSDRVTVARLRGTATRHARARAEDRDAETATAELRAIATEHVRGVGPRLRVDLLTEAAGRELGSHRYDRIVYWSGEIAARLLLLAGADQDGVERMAVETTDHLTSVAGRGGIGNPN